MLVGMGTVFSFLTILVFGMSAMSRIAMQFSQSATENNASDGSPSDEEVAAITAAIAQHRNNTTK